MSRLLEQVRHFAEAHDLFGQPGLVAVSGGADSVALLRSLLDVGCGPLTVGHINHQLRGAESDADEVFVRELAKEMGCECRVLVTDVAARADLDGDNLEATARQVRYAWLSKLAAETGAKWIATGHNADDQAETVLHRLIRGTGLQGLRGIAFSRDAESSERTASPMTNALRSQDSASRLNGKKMDLIRPLLATTRTDILAYLATLPQPFRSDSSNADLQFTRNRIRHELLPLLKTFNPDVVAVLGTLAEQASEAFDVLEQNATALLANTELPRAGNMLIFDAAKLTAASPFLVREAMRLVWSREGWPMGRMTAEHWHRLAGIVHSDPPAADFPEGVTARRIGRVVQIEKVPGSKFRVPS